MRRSPDACRICTGCAPNHAHRAGSRPRGRSVGWRGHPEQRRPHGPRPPRRDRGRHPDRALDELRRRRARRRRHRPPRARAQPALHPRRRRRARTACSRATAASAAPRSATRRRSAAGSRPRASSSSGGRADPDARLRPRRGRRGSRLSARHNLRVLPRPPLPPGPYLVVGLARSGVAAALALRSPGRRSSASTPARCRRAAGRVEAAGVPVHAGSPGVELLAGARGLVKSPGVPA